MLCTLKLSFDVNVLAFICLAPFQWENVFYNLLTILKPSTRSSDVTSSPSNGKQLTVNKALDGSMHPG